MTSLTRSHYPIVSLFHNEDNVPLAFPLASAAHTISMGRQLSLGDEILLLPLNSFMVLSLPTEKY